MLPRQDFIFTIGYSGPAAVIDGQAKRKYSKLSTIELAKKGLFRAAYSSAVWSKDSKELETVAEIYNSTTGSQLPVSSFQRLFGVYPDVEVKRSIVV
ncbi:MAG: hypothetical protein FWC97_12115 [Treponema sp.]|nr:hypothetical protein [Treponema sp.]